jgi:hypothetical protein
MSVVIEGIAAAIITFGVVKYYKKDPTKDEEKKIHGNFCVCFTKGTHSKGLTYIPWISRNFKTEEEYEQECTQVAEIALNPTANKYFRDEGINGFAFVDLSDGTEMMWISLREE